MLKVLREVEGRDWDSILLSSANPVDRMGLLMTLREVARCYRHFVLTYPEASQQVKEEAYICLRIAFDGGRFPMRKHLSKEQFGMILDCHLESLK